MNPAKYLILCLILLAQGGLAQDSNEYAGKAGQRVAVFEHADLNYRLDLEGAAYTYVDFSRQVPEASFAAIRFRPNAFSLVLAEDLGPGISAEQYAEIVQSTMKDKLDGQAEGSFKGYTDIGARDERGMRVFQKFIYADAGSTPITYDLSTHVDGERAYQLLTFASNEDDDVVLAVADSVLGGFSVIDTPWKLDLVVNA